MSDKKERIVPAIHPSRMKLREHAYNEWAFTIDKGVTPDDLLVPGYWAHVAANLRQQDEIRALADDFSWVARYIVQEVGVAFAKVLLMSKTDLQPLSSTGELVTLPGYTIEHVGIHAKWRVTRDVDSKVMRDKFNTRADALMWLENYGKSIAA